MLTGKHRAGAPTEGTRFTLGRRQDIYQERYWHDRMFESVEAIRAIAEDAGMPMTTLAIQWVLANPVITSPIVGRQPTRPARASVAAVDATPLDPRREGDSSTSSRRCTARATTTADGAAGRHRDPIGLKPHPIG